MAYELSRSIAHLLFRAAQAANDRFSAEIRAAGLTTRQFIIMLAIANEEGVSQTQLVKITGVDRSTLADVVSRLERKELLYRDPAPRDSRAYSVRLTPEGRRRVETALPIVKELDDALLENVPAHLRDDWLTVLREMGSGPRRGTLPTSEAGAPHLTR